MPALAPRRSPRAPSKAPATKASGWFAELVTLEDSAPADAEEVDTACDERPK